MDNLYIAGILRAVARDLDQVADRIARANTSCDPIAMLAVATRGRDDQTRRIACANIAVAEAVSDDLGHDPLHALDDLPPWPSATAG